MNTHAASSAPTADLALWMIDLLTADDRLGRRIREFAASQRTYVAAQPDLVARRLVDASIAVAAQLQQLVAQPAAADLCRCVTVAVFFTWHVDSHVRHEFLGHEDYRRFIETQANPEATLLSHLSTDPIVFPAIHSWMIPRNQIHGMDGAQTLRAIQAAGPPPLVIFVLPLRLLRGSAVRVRPPLAVDAIPKANRLYSRFGLAENRTELIDADVPWSVIGGIEWRP